MSAHFKIYTYKKMVDFAQHNMEYLEEIQNHPTTTYPTIIPPGDE